MNRWRVCGLFYVCFATKKGTLTMASIKSTIAPKALIVLAAIALAGCGAAGGTVTNNKSKSDLFGNPGGVSTHSQPSGGR